MSTWKVGDTLKLMDIIRLEEGDVISIVGGGGKTSTMFKLAEELKSAGKKVLVTTTTAIMMPDKGQYDLFLDASRGDTLESLMEGEDSTWGSEQIVVYISSFIREDKLKGPELEEVDKIVAKGYFDYILVEADGARCKPIKAPREGEPLLPSSTTVVVGVIGLDSVGKLVEDDRVHRIEIFCDITGLSVGSVITPESIYKLISHRDGLFKNSGLSKRYLILNKADNSQRLDYAREIESLIGDSDSIERTIVTRLETGEVGL